MCYQVLELYSACRCVYYQHPVDRCPRYGAPGHGVTQRTILVGYACLDHSSHSYSSDGHSYSEEGYASRPPKQRKRLDHALQDWKIQADQEISPKKTRSDEGNIRLEKEDDPEALVGESISRQHTAPLESNKPGHDGDDFEDYGSIHDDIDSEGSSSDESVASEAVTVISIASSTTTVDSDATEAIFRRLLLFQDLRYLWPQLVRRCVTTRMSVLTIERLLRRYSEDLSNLAASTEIMNDSDGSICLTACRFVRRSRLSIAHRISEFHHAEKDDYTEVDDDIKERLKKTIDETSGGFDDINFNYATSERFLFGTEPVIALQSSVKTLVGSQHPEGNGLGFGLFKMAEVHLSNIVSLVYEPPIKPGSHRIRWQCICGQKLYDDYTELQPGAILKLEQLLKEYCSERQVSKALLDLAAKLKPSRQNSIIAGFVKSCSSFWASNRTDTNLPRHQDSKLPPGELGVCSMAPESAEGDHNFVLLCVPFMRWVAKLWQAEVCRINSDQDFFRVLRYYYNRRGKTHWTRLRKVEAINFVKFEVFLSQLVDIQSCPDVPNETQAFDNYTFDPLPAETNPPIGPRLLAHLLEHPGHAEVLPVLYRKFPKKLRAKLQACPQKGSAAGWGVEFVEGLNWFVIFLCGCVGFLGALVSAIVWSVVQSDVQGGFAIAGFMLAFLGFCLGVARTEIQTA